MRLHWNSKEYDFVKYRGKVNNLNKVTLDQSRDRTFYYNLAKNYKNDKEFILTLIPIFLDNEAVHISSINSNRETQERTTLWYRKIQALPTIFADDCKVIHAYIRDNDLDYNQFFLGNMILDFLLYEKITIESFIILNMFTLFLTKNKKDSIIYEQMYDLKVEKYGSFLQIDKKRYSDIFKKTMK